MNSYTLNPAEFIQEMFGSLKKGWIEICYLAPDGLKLYPRTVIQWRELPIRFDDIDPDIPAIRAMNDKGYSCFFGVASRSRMYEPEKVISQKTGRPYLSYRRGNAQDAQVVTHLWADIDDASEGGRLRLTKQGMPPPSIIVSSGGGWHGYWKLVKPLLITDYNRDDVKRTLKGIAIALQSDTKVADLARIMRLPGTVNTKPGRGAFCEVVDYLPCAYDYRELEVTFASLVPVPMRVTREIPDAALNRNFPKWIESYLQHGAVEHERNNTAYAVARGLYDLGIPAHEVESLVLSRALADGLTDTEAVRTIASAARAPRNPATGLPRMQSMRMAARDKQLGGRNG